MRETVIYVGVVYNPYIHTGYRSVIPKPAAFPPAAIIAYTAITKPVIYAAIKTNVGSPVTGMEAIKAGIKPQYGGVHKKPTCGGITQTPGTQ